MPPGVVGQLQDSPWDQLSQPGAPEGPLPGRFFQAAPRIGGNRRGAWPGSNANGFRRLKVEIGPDAAATAQLIVWIPGAREAETDR